MWNSSGGDSFAFLPSGFLSPVLGLSLVSEPHLLSFYHLRRPQVAWGAVLVKSQALLFSGPLLSLFLLR